LGFRTLDVALAVGISAVAAFAKMTAAGLPDPGPAIPTRNVRWATAAGRDRRVLAPRPKPVVVWQISDTVGVLRAGSLVESGPADRVLLDPHHEYTEELLAAIAGNRAPIDFAGGPQRTEGVPMSPAGRQRQYCHA
jgi:hypothetical protein